MEKPAIVKAAEREIEKSGARRLKDPVTGKSYRVDYGTLKLILELYNADTVSDESKERFFKLPLLKIVNFLWDNAEFKR